MLLGRYSSPSLTCREGTKVVLRSAGAGLRLETGVKVPADGSVASENALRVGDDELAGCGASAGWLPVSSGRVRLRRRLFLREPAKMSIHRRLGIRTACQQEGH